MFLGKIGQENVFCDILQRKNSFIGYKNKKLKKSKNWHFSKVVNPWFWSKNGYFSKPFFLQYRRRKCLVRYTKKLFSSPKKNKKFKKSKNWHFFKAVNPWFWTKIGLFFQLFFLGNIGKENVFDDIQERKIFFSRL